MLSVALLYRTIFTIAGGWVTGRMAASRPVRHAAVLGVVGTVLGVVGAVAMRNIVPAWFSAVLIVVGFPAAVAGGKLAERGRPR